MKIAPAWTAIIAGCLSLVIIASGCRRSQQSTSGSAGAPLSPQQAAEIEQNRRLLAKADEVSKNPPSEAERRQLAALWSSIAASGSSSGGGLETDLTAIASALSEAVELTGLREKIPTAQVRSAVETVIRELPKEERQQLRGAQVPVALTARACFVLLGGQIAGDHSWDEGDVLLHRMNLRVEVSETQVVLKTTVPAKDGLAWPKTWARLFGASFQKPRTVPRSDELRTSLWKWLSGAPSLDVQDVSGKPLHGAPLTALAKK